MKIYKFINRISVKVAFTITILVIGLFVAFNFLAVNRGERVFTDVYGIIREHGTIPPGDEPFIAPSPNPFFPFGQPRPNIMITPAEHFKNRFQSSLLILGLVAILGAFGIGFLTSRIVSRPLNKLGTGMKKLRQSHYHERLEENDSEEFNALIKEFNDLAAELQRVEELRKNLISDTSHELKTPLASLTAQLEGLEDGVLTFDKERVKLLTEQVKRLVDMTDTLQDYARLRSQNLKPELKKFPIKEILNSIIESYKTSLTEKKISVHLDFPDNYSVNGDAKLLTRVFTNLIDNAVRYSKARNITIAANQSRIVFSDDGVGIPEQHLQDIFERFFRLEKSRSRETGGLGLGLAIVKEIIQAHDWKISAKIPDNKKGVAFEIELRI